MNKSVLSHLILAAWVPALAWAQAASPTTGQPVAPSTTQAGTATAPAAAPASTAQGIRDARASKLIGMDVRNAQNENLGEIKDLIIDVRHGRVQYAVLSFGGFMGLGDKLFAYPVSAFKTAADRDDLVLNVDKERLKEAPGFERNRWPELRKYTADVEHFFARHGIGDRDRDRDRPQTRNDLQRNPDLRRASELIGLDINDRSGRNAGEIKDLVVSMGNGRVHYVVVDFDKAWSPDDKLLALPLSALQFNARGKDATLNVSRGQLDMTRGFDENHWPDLNDARYRGDMDRFLSSIKPDTTSRSGSAEHSRAR